MACMNEIAPLNGYNRNDLHRNRNDLNELDDLDEVNNAPVLNDDQKKGISKVTYIAAIALTTMGVALMVVCGVGIANCILFGAEFIGEQFALCFATGLFAARAGNQLQEGKFKFDIGLQLGAVTIK